MAAEQPPGNSAALITVIQPTGASLRAELRELWRYRELLGFLAWRDVRVRYRQTLLGAAWAMIEPLVSVLLFTLIFNRLAGVQSGRTPYALHCFAAMLLWTFFGRALRAVTLSLTTNSGLLTKAYFPRLVLPLSGLLAMMVDFACALVMYLILVAHYGVYPGWAVLSTPLWVLLAALNALGIGLALAAVNVGYRDVSQAVPFLIQVWMFATPVAYPLATIPQKWLWLYQLNPMVGVVEGMRWALLPDYALDAALLLPSVQVALVGLLVGLVWFRRCERRFADIV